MFILIMFSNKIIGIIYKNLLDLSQNFLMDILISSHMTFEQLLQFLWVILLMYTQHTTEILTHPIWNIIYGEALLKVLKLFFLAYIIIEIPSNYIINFLRLSLLNENNNLSAKNKLFIRKRVISVIKKLLTNTHYNNFDNSFVWLMFILILLIIITNGIIYFVICL